MSLVAVVFLVFAGLSLFGVRRVAAVSSGPPVVEDSKEWFTTDETCVYSVLVEDVDGDGTKEIITGGRFYVPADGVYHAELRVWGWDSSTLTLKDSVDWVGESDTSVESVFVDDVNDDGVKEIITGGHTAGVGIYPTGQLRVWSWDGVALALEDSEEWYTTEDTYVYSVFVDDVDADGIRDIITGGKAYDGFRYKAQLRFWSWDGITLALEDSEEWYNVDDTSVESVFVDDVESDGTKEIITGGYFLDTGVPVYKGQLRVCAWDGATLKDEVSTSWYTIYDTIVYSVFVDDVDADGAREIITGGRAHDGFRDHGQLRVYTWSGAELTLEDSEDWYLDGLGTGLNSVESVFVNDVDTDGTKEIITGGRAYVGRINGQLRVWSFVEAALTLEESQVWVSPSDAYVYSVFANDVDDDGLQEILTGGSAYNPADGLNYGQLRVWSIPLVDSLNINVDVGAIHFRGELAEYYLSTSYRGTPITATQTAATLYRPDGTTTSLTTTPVGTGLYKISYTLPSNAPTGTYTLTVEASYQTNAKDLKGTTLKSFELSPTLTNWNAWLQTIQQDTATIKTDIGFIKLNLTAINGNITAIKGNIATIQTDIGTIKADVTTIKAKITSIEDNIATIQTDLGTVKADVSTIDTESIPSIADTQRSQGAPLYITTAFSVLAAAGALGTLALILRKRKPT